MSSTSQAKSASAPTDAVCAKLPTARVTTAGIRAANGVIHVIDKVLLAK